MAAAVMTRPTSSSTSSSSLGSSSRTQNTMSQYKTLIHIPPRLHLSNGASSSSSSSRDSLSSLSQSGGSDSGERKRSSTHSGGRTNDIKTVRRRDDGDSGTTAAAATGGRRQTYEKRDRCSRIVLNGELIESQLTPETQESICQVFSFNTRGSDFEESIGQVWPHRCSFVVKELIDTERAYVEALGDIIKGYISPLYGYLLSSGDGPNFISTVFSNIVKIHRYHLDLLDSLQSLCCRPKPLARLFIDQDFGLYTEYCTNYSKGNEYLEQSLANSSDLQTFILECQSKLDHSLPLHSHLIKPVQRILKYPLLLEELVKNFDEAHFAYPTVEEACRKMTKVAEHINSSLNKPAKKKSLPPSAIARIRSKEVEGLQRRRTATPVSPNSPTTTSTKFLTMPGSSNRSVSVEPGEIGTIAQSRNRRHRRNRKKQARRHLSVEDLYPDEHAITSSSEDDHLARVSDLKSFFENLNTTSVTTSETKPESLAEVAPLQRSKLSVFENHGNSDTSAEEKKKERHVAPEDMSAEWPSVRKTSVKFGSPTHRTVKSPPSLGNKGSPPASYRHSTSSKESTEKEKGKHKGNRKSREG